MNEAINSPIIRARQLTRIYRLGQAEIAAVDHIDLDILPGQMVVLKGNSGSGKSTLLSLLGGLDQPTEGELHVAGRDLRKASPAELTDYRRSSVGIIFQSFNLLPTLTVLENTCLPALLAGKPSNQVKARALELLDWLKLNFRLQHPPSHLSGGEMQRTAIARALINDPAIILADEPTGNLDSRNGEIVMELLWELNNKLGRTVVIATHSTLADRYAGLSLFLKDGVIAEKS